jgi:hypothetical protein
MYATCTTTITVAVVGLGATSITAIVDSRDERKDRLRINCGPKKAQCPASCLSNVFSIRPQNLRRGRRALTLTGGWLWQR